MKAEMRLGGKQIRRDAHHTSLFRAFILSKTFTCKIREAGG
jgi:hypothetical protein